MSYIDVWAAAVPNDQKAAFTEMCKTVSAAFKDNGALQVLDCWADEVPDGKLTSLPLAVKKAENESVTIGIIIWPDKETRNAGMAKAMSDPRMDREKVHSILDGARIIPGGFTTVSEG